MEQKIQKNSVYGETKETVEAVEASDVIDETDGYEPIPITEETNVTVDGDIEANVTFDEAIDSATESNEKFDEDAGEKEEDPKIIYHITHNDADALGCAIVCDQIKGFKTFSLFNGYDVVDNNIRAFLMGEDGKMPEFPDILLITDISALRDDTITFLEQYREAAKESGKELTLLWVDHHASNRRNETLDWCTVLSEDDNETPVSAAKVLYNIYYNEIDDKVKSYLGGYIEAISRYDTWEWKKHPGNYNEEYTAILIKQMGLIPAYHAISHCLQTAVENEAESITFTPELSMLLQVYIDKRKAVLDHVLEKCVSMEYGEYVVALMIPDETYFNECMEQVYNDNDDIDFVIGISPSRRSLSFRSKRNDLNLGRFAKSYFGGGGHPQAAGANVDRDVLMYWLEKYYEGMDHINSKKYKKKEAKKKKKASKNN